MFKTGQKVSYSTTGICVIDGIIKMGATGKEKEYYALKPLYQKGAKVYVPVENEELVAKIRPAIEKAEIEEIIERAKEEPLKWIDDDEKRTELFKEMLHSGSPLALIRLIGCIYLKQQELTSNRHRLRNSDANILSTAENLLYNEFAFCLDTQPEEVIPFIKSRME